MAEALEVWIDHELEGKAKEITEALSRWTLTIEWQKDGGKFIPLPHHWLDREQWRDSVRRIGEGKVVSENTLRVMDTTMQAISAGPYPSRPVLLSPAEQQRQDWFRDFCEKHEREMRQRDEEDKRAAEERRSVESYFGGVDRR
jgi:hypothetical protein